MRSFCVAFDIYFFFLTLIFIDQIHIYIFFFFGGEEEGSKKKSPTHFNQGCELVFFFLQVYGRVS